MVLDRKTKFAFGKISEEYDKFREDYPKRLLDDLISVAKLKDGSRILEIGSGTGKATLPFAELGLQIVCIDVNQELIDRAVENLSKYRNIKYICGSFEDVRLPQESFDLIFAAQAWHWIDPKVGYRKVEKLLENNGTFAIFWKLQNDSRSKLLREMDELYIKYCPEWNRYTHSVKRVRKEIRSAKNLSLLTLKKYAIKRNYTKKEIMGLVGTYSFVADLKESKRQTLFDQLSDLFKRKKRADRNTIQLYSNGV